MPQSTNLISTNIIAANIISNNEVKVLTSNYMYKNFNEGAVLYNIVGLI